MLGKVIVLWRTNVVAGKKKQKDDWIILIHVASLHNTVCSMHMVWTVETPQNFPSHSLETFLMQTYTLPFNQGLWFIPDAFDRLAKTISSLTGTTHTPTKTDIINSHFYGPHLLHETHNLQSLCAPSMSLSLNSCGSLKAISLSPSETLWLVTWKCGRLGEYRAAVRRNQIG